MSGENFLNGRVTLHAGDSRDVLKTLADNSIDSIVTDPPYALVSIVKRFGAANAAGVKVPEGGSGAYARASAGTGTTGEAAFREGFNAIPIEREEEYQADIRRRMGLVLSGPDERSRESIKARTAGQPIDHGPLFGGLDTPPPHGAGESTGYSRTNNRTDRIEVVKS